LVVAAPGGIGSRAWILAAPNVFGIELALGLVALYWWETERFAINTWLGRPNVHPSAAALATLHWQFAVHVGMFALMSLATFIDIDELTIPDAITVPGTIAALVIAALCQAPGLPVLLLDPSQPKIADLTAPLSFDFPLHATEFLNHWSSLATGLACFVLWCFALLPRRWRMGVGPVKAWRVMWRRIFARPEWRWVLPILIGGAMGIAYVWMQGQSSWRHLMSALIGMAAGGGMVWLIRVIGGVLLNREAMGFGDVTLLAMIGAFIGWQASIMVFFISPFVALIVAILRWLMHGEKVIPYGPFLCLATSLVILLWAPIWDRLWLWFELPWLVPSAIAVCLPAPFLLLYLLRRWRERLLPA
jgi:prepilin signal peptidase PulO-like enzyme (type II secretory pathway)